MKIALGTVQFGLDYGVANIKGQPSMLDVSDILNKASASGIETLDTAAAYGNSEKILGTIGVSNFSVVSKIPPNQSNIQITKSYIRKHLKQSLKDLRLDRLYGYIFHRPLELLNSGGEALYNELMNLKYQGIINKIGVSIYGPEDLEQLVPYFDFDLVQAPMNIIDRRMLDSGWLAKLSKKDVEIHIRSAFLQGLLLMSTDERPDYFKPWSELFDSFEGWLRENNYTALEAAIGFLNGIDEVDKIVVGVDSMRQLSEIISISQSKIYKVPDSFKSDEIKLINPSLWKI